MATKTIELVESRIVPISAAMAVRLVADFSRISEWDPSITKSSRSGDVAAQLEVGATFDLEMKFMGVASSMDYRLAELTESRATLHGEGGTVSAVDIVEAKDLDNGTAKVTWTARLTFRGPVVFALPLMRGSLDRLGVNAVDGMAAWLAKQTPNAAAAAA